MRAAKEGMSLEAYARRALQRASMDNGDDPKSLLDQAEKYFGKQGGVEIETPPRSTRRKRVMVRQSVPSGRLGTPEEIADAAVWLVSPRAAWVNGVAVVVDGGQSKAIR